MFVYGYQKETSSNKKLTDERHCSVIGIEHRGIQTHEVKFENLN